MPKNALKIHQEKDGEYLVAPISPWAYDRFKRGYRKGLREIKDVWPVEKPLARFLWPDFVLESHRAITPDEHECHHVNYPNFSVEYHIAGDSLYEQNGHADVASAGSVYLIHRNSDTRILPGPSRKHDKLVLSLTGAAVDDAVEAMGLAGKRLIGLTDAARVHGGLVEIIGLMREKRPGTECALVTACYGLLAHISGESVEPAYPPELLTALRLMEENINRDLRVQDIAAASGISRRSMERLFVRHVGRSPAEHFAELRMRLAVSLASGGLMPFKEIAKRTGFANLFYFSSAFKNRYGMSPREYRQTFGRRGNARPDSGYLSG